MTNTPGPEQLQPADTLYEGNTDLPMDAKRRTQDRAHRKTTWRKQSDQLTILPLGRADLHMHSTYSDGLGTVPDILTFVSQQRDLDVIALTDHDTIEGALRARELAHKQSASFEVIVGEEVSTREGHLLTLFVEQRIPPGLSVERSIELAHAQGGIAIIAHPFNRIFRHSIQFEVVNRLKHAPLEARPDGIETLNGSFAGIGSSRLAMARNRRHYGWPETGSSDAHTVTAIGCAFTWFAGTSADDLRASLLAATTMPGGSFWQTADYWKLASYWAINGRPGRPSRAERLRHLGQSERLALLRQFGHIARRPLQGRFSQRSVVTFDALESAAEPPVQSGQR
jgi:predicted metal-dependent phosphoesterase TrpH